MNKRELVAEVLTLVCDALLAGKDGRRTNPQYYINRIKWLLDAELKKDDSGPPKERR